MIQVLIIALSLLALQLQGQQLYTNQVDVTTTVTDYYYNAALLPLGFSPATWAWMPTSPSATLTSDQLGLIGTLNLTNYGNSTVAFVIHLSSLGIGSNGLVVTQFWPDPISGLWITNVTAIPIYKTGWKLFATDGRTNLVCAVLTNLTNPQWTLVTNSNPTWGTFTGTAQFFDLRTNGISLQVYRTDTLPATVVAYTTNIVTTNPPAAMAVPMPPGVMAVPTSPAPRKLPRHLS